MKASDIPNRFVIPFANSVIAPYIRAIPQVSSGIPGEASLDEGFPPENFDPVSAGGVPPSGADFNGLLNQMSAWNRWTAAAGLTPWNSTFAASSLGGYPAGAIVLSATTTGLAWLSAVDDNTANPDVAGTGWIPIPLVQQTTISATTTTFTMTVKTNCYGLTGSGARSASLPSTNLFIGYEAIVEDLVGNFGVPGNNVTISAPGGQTISGLASFVLNVNRQSARFRYYGSNKWSVKA